MAKISRLAGATSNVLVVFVQDSSSTTGAGLTGLLFNAAGLTCYYKRNTGTASAAATLATITTFGTFASGGLKEIDATNLPGFYEFHPPDVAFASGAKSVAFLLKGATNMVPCPLEVELTAVDNQDAVRGGMTALPNAAANANGGLPVLSSSGTTLAYTVTTVTTTATATNLANLPAVPTDWLTAAGVKADAVTKIQAGLSTYAGGDTSGTTTLLARIPGTIAANGSGFTALGDTRIANLDAAVTTRMATYTQPTGFLAATFPGTVASTTNITAGTITTATNLTNAPTAGDFTATMKTSLNAATPASVAGAVGSVTGAVGSVAGSVGSLATQAKADVENAVWNGLHSAHVTAGTFGAYLDAAISGVSTGGTSAASIATAVWQDLLSSSDFTTVGSAGKLIKDNLTAPVATASALATLATAVGTPAQASQIPANFTTGTFASAGVFAAGALANSPTGNLTLADGSITTAKFAAGATIPRVTLADTLTTYTNNTPQTGDTYAKVNPLIASGAFTAPALALAPAGGGGGGSVTVAGYASGQDPATLVWGAGTRSLTDKAGFSINLAQTGLTARDLGSVADSALTVGDGFVAAIAGTAGKETVSDTSYVVKTPSTGTVVRTFVLDSATSPTSRS